MSTKHVRTTGDLVRFGAALRIDCRACGATRTLVARDKGRSLRPGCPSPGAGPIEMLAMQKEGGDGHRAVAGLMSALGGKQTLASARFGLALSLGGAHYPRGVACQRRGPHKLLHIRTDIRVGLAPRVAHQVTSPIEKTRAKAITVTRV